MGASTLTDEEHVELLRLLDTNEIKKMLKGLPKRRLNSKGKWVVPRSGVLHRVAVHMKALLDTTHPPTQVLETETRKAANLRVPILRGVRPRLRKAETLEEFETRLKKRFHTIYAWVRRYSPNCATRKTGVRIDSLIVPKVRCKKYSAYDIFKEQHKDKPSGFMTSEGKSDIGGWSREAHKRFKALPAEEIARLTAIAEERTAAEKQKAEENGEDVDQAQLADQIPGHIEACWEIYSGKAGWEGFTISGGLNAEGEPNFHICQSEGTNAAGQTLGMYLLEKAKWNMQNLNNLVTAFLHDVFNPLPGEDEDSEDEQDEQDNEDIESEEEDSAHNFVDDLPDEQGLTLTPVSEEAVATVLINLHNSGHLDLTPPLEGRADEHSEKNVATSKQVNETTDVTLATQTESELPTDSAMDIEVSTDVRPPADLGSPLVDAATPTRNAPQQSLVHAGGAALPAVPTTADLAPQCRTTEAGEVPQKTQEKIPHPEVPSAAAAPSAADESRTMELGEALQGVQEKTPPSATLSDLQPCESTKKNPRSKKRPGPTSTHTQRKKPRIVQETTSSSTVAPEPLAVVAGNDASSGDSPVRGRRVRKPAARAMNNPE
ncbi:hypothetical protein EIP86_003878 [Pleurotus ostreatoroseus]|nr:hypothetical protein EIP86_003878 [Pleurotus ostreatoroseus]